MPTIVLAQHLWSVTIEDVILGLGENGIDARVFFWPLSHAQVPGKKAFDKPYLSETINLHALNLPSFFGMHQEEIQNVSRLILEFLQLEGK
jgi:perosamine synthetase